MTSVKPGDYIDREKAVKTGRVDESKISKRESEACSPENVET